MAGQEAEIGPYAQELTALLVEDDPVTRLWMAAQLRGVFKELVLARDGQEGLELFRARRPQLVFTDNRMPRLSGLAMTATIRAEDAKVPVILSTSAMDTDLLVRAINLGVAAFLAKPVLPEHLRQTVAMVVGMLERDFLQRRTLEQDLALLQFRDKYHEYQQELAFRKELAIQENDFQFRPFSGAAGAGRGRWLAQVGYHPHDIMCGDSYSLRRLPDGSLLAFLGDAMGKGLAASLTTSLGVYTFNLLVDAVSLDGPFQFERFVRRFTAMVRKRLLEDEVFPLTLAWLPATGAWLETAAFGMPPILAGTPDRPVRKLRANNPPISAYSEAFRTTRHDLEQTRSLLLYTDGLNEAACADGGLYREHLDLDFQGSAGRDQLWAAFQARVAQPEDDVALLFLTRLDGVPLWQERLAVPAGLEPLETACTLLEERIEAHAALDPDARCEFMVAVREALLNAYEHGTLAISGAEKHRLLEEGLYYQRLEQLAASPRLPVTVDVQVQAIGPNQILQVTVRDDGPGFDPDRLLGAAADSMMLSGRGLRLVRRYTDAFLFNEKGSAITLLRIHRGDPYADHPHREP